MNQNETDRLNYRLHKTYGPTDRDLPGIYIPKKMPDKKVKFLPKAGRAIKNFFTLKPFGAE